jgi:hypothetical protein
MRLLWHGAIGRAAALAIIAALVPLPVAAGETSQPAPAKSLKASVEKVVARESAATARTAVARRIQEASPADKSQLESGSFFKTPAGIICLAIVGAGVGYAIYSASNDRIHSQARK